MIELMLVVAIIGLLAAIAIPKFGDAIIRAKEAAVRGHMGSLRSAISIYYADNEGTLPAGNSVLGELAGLTAGGKYLDLTPRISIPSFNSHNSNAFVTVGGPLALHWHGAPGHPPDAAWAYESVTGKMVVNCFHPDSRGVIWSQQ